MNLKIIGLVGLLLTGCNKPTATEKDVRDNETVDKSVDSSIDGVWTDGSGPNASFAIENDSIRDVEHFTSSKFYKRGDTVSVYYPDDTLTALIYKIHADTLVYENYGQKTKYWRFKD